MQNDATGDRFIRGEDLQKDGKWAEFSLEIDEVFPPDSVKGADGKTIEKPVLTFAKAEKWFVLGKVNRRLIRCLLGTDPSKWPTNRITLYPAVGNWFGVSDAVAVRVRIPRGHPRPFINPINLGKDITGQELKPS